MPLGEPIIMRDCYSHSPMSPDEAAEKPTSFEVDLILDHKFEGGEKYYFVKWKNCSSDSNSWVLECHLRGCEEAIDYYNSIISSYSKITKKILHHFVRDLTSRKPYDTLILTKTCALCFDVTEDYINSLQLTVSQMKQKVREILDFSRRRLKLIGPRLFTLMQFAEKRKPVLVSLEEWEVEINRTNRGTYITVENKVDLECAPTSFQFIDDYIYTSVKIWEGPVAFCRCDDCFKNKRSCCPRDSDGHFAYSKYKRLELLPGNPIYECNQLCKCGSDCPNRVVQHGQKVKVCIFRTSNGCGWGLKTLEPIEKDQFVLEYLGEVITSEMAEARGEVYDYSERSYLFDLDFWGEKHCFTVDAGHRGNASHFINHSCDPNLQVFAVWVEHSDPRLPRLAFFAKRKIRLGEELTFDYKMLQGDRYASSGDFSDSKRVLCLCNSKNCKKYLV